MSTEKILDKASFLKGVEVGRTMWRWTGDWAEPAPPETGPFQMKIDLQPFGSTTFNADMRGTFQIDWGDGVSEAVNNSGSDGIKHVYPGLGVYTITIEGDLRLLGHGPWSRNGLTAVVELLSPLPASVETLSYAFSGCEGLTSIPADLFSRCQGIQTVIGCFSETPITAIPSGLFDNCPAINSFESCFANCSALTAIPAGLFDACTGVTTFASCFLECSAITALPAGLFDHCTEVQIFSSCFNGCTALVDIPDGLFRGQSKVKQFSSCFAWCSNLASIPDDLFEGCGAVTHFDNCFQMCSSLEQVGPGLFDDCTLVLRFRACFSGCTALTSVPDGIFDCCTAVSQLTECFMRCVSLTSAPELWNKFPSASHTKCFYNCSNASNYGDIPSGWK